MQSTTRGETKRRFVEIKHEPDKDVVVLDGDWTIRNAAPIEKQIEHAIEEISRHGYEVVADRIGNLDTSGAFLLKKLTVPKHLPLHLSDTQRKVLDFLPAYSEYTSPIERRPTIMVASFTFIGKNTIGALEFSW